MRMTMALPSSDSTMTIAGYAAMTMMMTMMFFIIRK